MDQDQQRDYAEERYNELIDHDELDPPEALTSVDPRVEEPKYDDQEDERLAHEADVRLLGGWS